MCPRCDQWFENLTWTTDHFNAVFQQWYDLTRQTDDWCWPTE